MLFLKTCFNSFITTCCIHIIVIFRSLSSFFTVCSEKIKIKIKRKVGVGLIIRLMYILIM